MANNITVDGESIYFTVRTTLADLNEYDARLEADYDQFLIQRQSDDLDEREIAQLRMDRIEGWRNDIGTKQQEIIQLNQ